MPKRCLSIQGTTLPKGKLEGGQEKLQVSGCGLDGVYVGKEFGAGRSSCFEQCAVCRDAALDQREQVF
jgi:hypothetical protein